MAFRHVGSHPNGHRIRLDGRDIDDRRVENATGTRLIGVDIAVQIGSPHIRVADTSHDIDFLRVAALPYVLSVGRVATRSEPDILFFELFSVDQCQHFGSVELVDERVVGRIGIARSGDHDHQFGGTHWEYMRRQRDRDTGALVERTGPLQGLRTLIVIRMDKLVSDNRRVDCQSALVGHTEAYRHSSIATKACVAADELAGGRIDTSGTEIDIGRTILDIEQVVLNLTELHCLIRGRRMHRSLIQHDTHAGVTRTHGFGDGEGES